MEPLKTTMNPNGGVAFVRESRTEPLGEQPDLFESIVDPSNVAKAWKQVKANQGAAGIDGISLEEFPTVFRPQWERILEDLKEGRYHPTGVRQVAIPKADGGQRLLGVPTVLDRLIQQAILQRLTPLFDPFFSESSFGFRPNRNAHGAVKQIQALAKQGYQMAVDIDLEKFFDNVPHGLLMAEVAKKVKDKRVLRLIGLYLRAGVWVQGVFQPTNKGVPQGSPLSPLLANILLDRLDKELERRGHRFARYADDLMLLVKSKRAAERVMASLKRFLPQKLHLPVNEQKSKVAPLADCTFLGFNLKHGKIRWSEKSERKFKERIRQITSRSRGCSMEKILEELRLYLRGWMNYFGLSSYYRPIPGLDDWIRRRVRMGYWKQWKRPRTRIRNLLKLGTFRKHAVSTGRSSKGYWRLSKTLGTQAAMTNLWLEQQGLLSLKSLWVSLAPLR